MSNLISKISKSQAEAGHLGGRRNGTNGTYTHWSQCDIQPALQLPHHLGHMLGPKLREVDV
eukprot:19559-Eustigmatos_ZCMA.PRE.1